MHKNKFRPKKNERDQLERVAWLLLIATGILVTTAYFKKDGTDKAEFSSKSTAELIGSEHARYRENVKKHMADVGDQLNRDRIRVEYDNVKLAPPITAQTKAEGVAPDLSAGVPTKQEPYHRAEEQKEERFVNPEYADVQIHTILQENKALEDWEYMAQKKFIEEFRRNASADGVDVAITPEYDVEIRRAPQSAGAVSQHPQSSHLRRDQLFTRQPRMDLNYMFRCWR